MCDDMILTKRKAPLEMSTTAAYVLQLLKYAAVTDSSPF